MKKCLYCNEEIKDKGFSNKIGFFCSEEHFDEYYKNLSNEELAFLMHSICPCSDEDE